MRAGGARQRHYRDWERSYRINLWPEAHSEVSKPIKSHVLFIGAGSGSIGDSIASAKQMAKGYAPGAYDKASYAKHAALDWITNMTANTSEQDNNDKGR